eukprot:1194576-Prorocentrum_minimum.AAC.1
MGALGAGDAGGDGCQVQGDVLAVVDLRQGLGVVHKHAHLAPADQVSAGCIVGGSSQFDSP